MNYDERDKARFSTKYQVMEDGCWDWTGRFFIARDLPYGQFYMRLNGRDATVSAHRAAWRLYHGEIQNGLHVLHGCNNSKCVNPKHLYLGTHKDNMRDRDRAGRTSKGEKRYNWRRTPVLMQRIKNCLRGGLTVKETCQWLEIGWQTFYRARAQDPEIVTLINATKSAHYSAAARRKAA